MSNSSQIRNIAIIAHVDHGKTTLVDQLLRQSGTIADAKDRVMYSDTIEKYDTFKHETIAIYLIVFLFFSYLQNFAKEDIPDDIRGSCLKSIRGIRPDHLKSR